MATYIVKPGCDPSIIKPDKTNLQLREMQMMKQVYALQDIEANIVSIPWLLSQDLAMSNSDIIIFNSAKCFEHELDKLFAFLSVLEEVNIILVSNDCRLNFGVESGSLQRLLSRVNDGITVTMLTNATVNLDEYAGLVLPGIDSGYAMKRVPIISTPLYTLPTNLVSIVKTDMDLSSLQSKTIASVFTCMHFCDYSDYRKNLLTMLKTDLGDDLVLSGDMSGMIVNGEQIESIVTDTKDVLEWYRHVKTTPVILEPNYEYFGVIPNRVAEAIQMLCLPVVITDNTELDRAYNTAEPAIPIVKVNEAISAIRDFCANYDSAKSKTMLERLQLRLSLDKLVLSKTLKNILKYTETD
jgi:hypothetical protein